MEYLNHTSLKTYFPYMMGGGYVLSADLAAVILGINQQSRGHDLLKFMPNEDVSVGFWLMSVDMRRVDHQRVVGGRCPSRPACPAESLQCSADAKPAMPLLWVLSGPSAGPFLTRSGAPVAQIDGRQIASAIAADVRMAGAGDVGPPVLLREGEEEGRRAGRGPRLLPDDRRHLPRRLAHPAQAGVHGGDAVPGPPPAAVRRGAGRAGPRASAGGRHGGAAARVPGAREGELVRTAAGICTADRLLVKRRCHTVARHDSLLLLTEHARREQDTLDPNLNCTAFGSLHSLPAEWGCTFDATYCLYHAS